MRWKKREQPYGKHKQNRKTERANVAIDNEQGKCVERKKQGKTLIEKEQIHLV